MTRKSYNHRSQTNPWHPEEETPDDKHTSTPTQQLKPSRGRGVKGILLAQIFTLDSVVVRTLNLFSSHRGFLTSAMHHHRETL